MTKLPMETWDVKGVEEFWGGESPAYALNQVCAAPGCQDDGQQYGNLERHHLWRRSFLNGDFWWVKLPDGTVVGNCVNLCPEHHRDVTENKARVLWDSNRFVWMGHGPTRPLQWQPPIYSTSDSETDPEKPEWTADHAAAPTTCPACKQTIKPQKPKTPLEEKRIRKTWAVSVPKDQREDGADVLDELIEAAHDELAKAGLPYGDAKTAKYFILSTTLALFVTHAERILE